MKCRKIPIILFFTIMTMLTIASLEEISFLSPKVNSLTHQLVVAQRQLTLGRDFEKVQMDYEKLAKSVGMKDVIVSIEGKNLYGSVVKLNVAGNIESDTISRKIINQTEIPYQAKIQVLVNRY